ncbi:MAG: hypothetical protein IJR48_04065 [Oscillibacter sp.]|nr:hypothetical protein [Oscillibacter sp.]MBQ9617520.1 hypothetical protein [Oscillibacter sp.]
METYEVWRATMYAVGVFVTCNVGGLALRLAVGRLTKREAVAVHLKREAVRVMTPEEFAKFLSGLSDSPGRQTFEEMRRQVDGLDAEPEPDEEADEDTEATDGEKDFFSD